MSDDGSMDPYRGAVFEVESDGKRIPIVVGELNPALDALLVSRRVDGGWAFITAWNPGDERPAREENERAQALLERQCRDAGLRVWHGDGASPDRKHVEPSILVAPLGVASAAAFGRAFRQRAIVVGAIGEPARLVDLADGATRDAFNVWFEDTFGQHCPIDAAVMGRLIPGVLENNPSLFGDDVNPAAVPRTTNVYRTLEVPPALRTTLHPPRPEAFDTLVGRAPFTVIGAWSYSALYWWQSNGRVRAFLRFPKGGGYSSDRRDLEEMKKRLTVLAELFRVVPHGTLVDISENMGDALVRITSQGRTWSGEFSWSSLLKSVAHVLAGNGEKSRLRQDRSPSAVFRAVALAMEHLADVLRQHPSSTVEFTPPLLSSAAGGDGDVLDEEDDLESEDDDDLEDDIDDLEDDVDDGETPIPEPLLAACRAVPGGASLRWSVVLKDGKKVKGWLALPSVDDLREGETSTFNEGDPGFSIAPSAGVEVCWPAESDDDTVFLFDDDAVLLEECTVADVFERMLDNLGMTGWATGLSAAQGALLSRVRQGLHLTNG